MAKKAAETPAPEAQTAAEETVPASEENAVEEIVAKWRANPRLQAVLTPVQLQGVVQIVEILAASPSTVKPVNGTVVFSVLWDLVVPTLVEKKWLAEAPTKSAAQLLDEGAQRLKAIKAEAAARAAEKAKAAAAQPVETTAEGSAEGPQPAPGSDPPPAGGADGVRLNNLSFSEKCMYDGTCHSCKQKFLKGSPIVMERMKNDKTGKLTTTRVWDIVCPEGQRLYEALMAEEDPEGLG